ncbi:UBX domain-containing protein 1-like isoform X1 [Centruroides sculpturatus]|uniref:UBX domain-containing protein 1-like isoform X1 n=1 Tax=Centruroides sculpturatus TaxID=218467 RepID=UPI000C6E8BA3|nr:UBX domain-containing protein 1-like isoform X1 [Centruroides sculpturatus]
MSSELNVLLEMGFPPQRAEKALHVSGNQIEPAMEWLLAHSDDPEIDAPLETEGQNKEETAADDKSGEKNSDVKEETSEQPKSVQCDECGKRFRSDAEIEFHAVKSGHKSFSESTEEIKPLTEQEKQEQLKKLEEKIRQRRLEKEEQERKSAIEKEKLRRRTGQEIALARQKLEEEQQRREAELIRQEKLEAKLARQRILEEIERDKLARKEMFGTVGNTAPVISTVNSSNTVSTTTTTVPQRQYDQCKLQIRLTNGQILNQTFGSNEELAAVRLFVQLNRSDGNCPFSLMTNFPKRIFNDEDMSKPLSALGLVPSAVLIVTKQQ